MNAYSQDLRNIAIKLYKSGKYTKQAISELVSVSYKTVRSWIKLYESTGECKLVKPSKTGRNRLFDDKEAILSYLKLNPDVDGTQLRNALAPHVSQNCFYNTLNRLDITYKKRGKLQKTL